MIIPPPGLSEEDLKRTLRVTTYTAIGLAILILLITYW